MYSNLQQLKDKLVTQIPHWRVAKVSSYSAGHALLKNMNVITRVSLTP